MKTCPICQRKLATKAGLKQHMESVHKTLSSAPVRRGNGRPSGVRGTRVPGAATAPFSSGSSGSVAGDGTIRIGRSELISSITLKAKQADASGRIPMEAQSCAWLSKLAKVYDQIVWHSITIEFKPAVGTVFSGSIVIGFDWNPDANQVDRKTVQACMPSVEAPIWQPLKMSLPSARLQTRRFYLINSSSASDKSPGVLLYNLKSTSQDNDMFVGDIWVTYSVSLMGPSA